MARASLPAYLTIAAEAPARRAGSTANRWGRSPVALRRRRGSTAPRGELASPRRHGIRVDALDAAGAPRGRAGADPDDVAAAWLVHHGHRLDPGVAHGGARAHREGRGRRRSGTTCSVRALDRANGIVRGVVTDDGVIEADTMIVAAGPWSGTAPRSDRGQPAGDGARGWLVRVAPPPGLCTTWSSSRMARRAAAQAGRGPAHGRRRRSDGTPPAEVGRAAPPPSSTGPC